jgi:cardiolipin synthase
MTIPTYITLIRIALIPWIVNLLLHAAWQEAGMLIIGALVTDYLDGALARYLNQESRFGALLDHLADKLLLISCIAALIFMNVAHDMLTRQLLIVFLIRELVILMGSTVLYCTGKIDEVKPVFPGKVAFTSQLICIIMICWQLATGISYPPVLMILIGGITAVSLLSSGIYYIKRGVTLWHTQS